ncbi:selenocysteine-specific translation elongation factor [Campylobacter sp. JMF_04 NA10]|uniref:selenocysteine-specific translation elongation factor n=1 Tax=Campylobacter sp. JMF_04 NA10 TaxID=2983824 RepID=UPI0022E9A207|nr:selenocysteine-specific translation elongation factor [Campylobacter sp. JMF_04 NA10]MDA3076169.1 selenocysteine-specific translation elongation factor [Campylobacter sp. JMF_04 NA10]
MNSVIIGTAGHIDHGKTALIKALNGVDGDKLASEIERGITIDLSFSNLKSKNANIAFIDVPGHENLVKTMISGAYAFDCALLIVASDDGLMPQSREHIEILSLLDVKSVVLCITKCDLTDSPRQNEVKKECEEFIAKFSNLQILNTFFLSAKTNLGVDELKSYLFNIKPKPRKNGGILHYYIDRIFTLKGIGTVVTGSLISGAISRGEKLLCADCGKILTAKSLQIHDTDTQVAYAPNRVAIALDAKTSELERGYILTKKGFFRGFNEADTLFRGKIAHGEDVSFCVGSKQTPAKARIIKELDSGEFLINFKFEKTMFLKFDEPFVCLANSRVCGGGRVLNAVIEPLKKANKAEFLTALLHKNFKKAFEILSKFHRHGFGLFSAYQRFDMDYDSAKAIAKTIPNTYFDEATLCVYDNSAIGDIKELIKFIIDKNPHAVFSPTSIALKLSWASESLASLVLSELERASVIEKTGGVYIKKGANLQDLKQSLEGKIFDIIKKGGIAPLAPYNIYEMLDIDRVSGDDALKKLTYSKKVVRLAHNLFVEAGNLSQIIKKLYDLIKEAGFADVANVKESLNLSRKFAISYLEYLDNLGDIITIDNKRYLKK